MISITKKYNSTDLKNIKVFYLFVMRGIIAMDLWYTIVYQGIPTRLRGGS